LGNAGQGTSNFIALIDPDYEKKAILGNDAGAEQIAALHPDVVILKSFLAEKVGQPIEAIGIPVVYVDFETPEQYPRDLAILGQIFDDPVRAETAAAYYRKMTTRIEQAVTGQTRPRTLMLVYSAKDGTAAFKVPPSNWMQTRMMTMAGGDPVWTEAALGGGWTTVSLEQIAAWNPDQIFVIAYREDSAQVVAKLKSDPNWQPLRAVQNGNLHAFPGDLYSWDQPDPRWILGLTWLAGRLHPEQFPGLDITAETQNFYQTLYGLDAEFFNIHIRPTFHGDLP
jgi:iron complex transport system substrate-binding protein